MTIYGDLEDGFLREFNSSTKESLEDIAFDEEEKSKIIYNISGTNKANIPELRVDYSNFSNHVFFASAYSSVNFSLNRILEYPLDGELKDINGWKESNSGYENWFFDNFPKDTGHIFLTSGSNGPFVVARDHENKVNFRTGSFTIEGVFNINPNMPSLAVYPLVTIQSDNTLHGIRTYLVNNGTTKTLNFAIFSGSTQSIQLNYDAYISGTHHIALVYNNPDGTIYVDGQPQSSGSFTGAHTGSHDLGSKDIQIGYLSSSNINYYYSGSVDEVRIWASSRPASLIKKNFGRTTYANHTSSLGFYCKFNEPWLTSSNKFIDYSGNSLEARFSGTYAIATNFVSGTLSNFIQDFGDPILDFTNDRVNSFVTEQRNSGSTYDKENQNHIFELFPSFMIDEDGSEEQIKMLLLIARHWDRLKLYIQHLASVYNSTVASFDDTPSDFLNLIASHYGIDIGGVYESSDPFQYFYGEDVLSTGSLDSSMRTVRDQIKRNIVNNLIHLYKTKSTKEALKAALRTLGLDDSIININQYSTFSGGIETTYEPKTVEKRTIQFDGSEGQYITLCSSSHNDLEHRTYQFRFALLSGSYTGSLAPLTSSLFRIEVANSASNVLETQIWRENLTSSKGKLALIHSSSNVIDSSTSTIISSSLFEAYNNNWINASVYRAPTVFGFNVVGLERDEISFHFSGSGTMAGSVTAYNPSPGATVKSCFGTIAGRELYSKLQEVRIWNRILTSSVLLEKHTKDFESLVMADFFNDIDGKVLLSHLKLDDITGSAGTEQIHDYLDSKSGSTFTGFSSSAAYNFPGTYIRKLEPSYQYDFNIDNDKIRIKASGSSFTPSDVTKDIQFVSVDFSPVSSLNREIVKWLGDIEQFADIVGHPYLRYRDEVTKLNAYRNKFFKERVNRGIDFDAYLQIIKWFDSNFTYFLSQLIPLDLVSSLSNFVIEPHLLEYNKVKTIFPYTDFTSARLITGSVVVTPIFTASSPISIPVSDPGRFGSFGSASAFVSSDTTIDYSSSMTASSLAVNHRNFFPRKTISDYLSGTSHTGLSSSYGNAYYFTQISCSNFERDILNANTNFHISGVHNSLRGSTEESSNQSVYYSCSSPPINTSFTRSFVSVQDARWQWFEIGKNESGVDVIAPAYDHGIGYGGAAGQLWEICKKSIVGEVVEFAASGAFSVQVGKNAVWNRSIPNFWIQSEGEGADRMSVILWPSKDAYDGVRIYNRNGQSLLTASFEDSQVASSFGPKIDIEKFTNLSLQVVGNTSHVVKVYMKFLFKFQFFDEDVGNFGFESALSSSIHYNGGATKGFRTELIEHSYESVVPFDAAAGAKTFSVNFERELPRSKHMRVHITAITEGNASTEANAVLNVLVKGILSKGTSGKDLLSFRNQ